MENNLNNKKYFISTYGCQMNVHESEKIAGIFEKSGMSAAADVSEADYIVFNTCCIRDSAEKKILGNIGALKKYYERNRELKIIICGCMTQQDGAENRLIKRFPYISAVLGTNHINSLETVISALESGEKHVICVNEDIKIYEDETVLRHTWPSAFVNIMYGCNNFCSYCIVPYVRGRERSRNKEAILTEIKQLVDDGFKEITLLGQNVNSYGFGSDDNFVSLLEDIDRKTGIERVRFMTSHPKDLSDELIFAMRDLETVCNSIHLPVQSGSDRILKLMNRRYTSSDYLKIIEKLRRHNPGITISTDIIVGFPGETEEDFRDTIKLVNEVRYDSAFTFKYSKRTGTVAAKMDGHLSDEIKTIRINELVARIKELNYESNVADVGKNMKVLIERPSARDVKDVCGRSEGNKMVNLAGNSSLAGKIVDVKITKAKRTTLFGELVK